MKFLLLSIDNAIEEPEDMIYSYCEKRCRIIGKRPKCVVHVTSTDSFQLGECSFARNNRRQTSWLCRRSILELITTIVYFLPAEPFFEICTPHHAPVESRITAAKRHKLKLAHTVGTTSTSIWGCYSLLYVDNHYSNPCSCCSDSAQGPRLNRIANTLPGYTDR